MIRRLRSARATLGALPFLLGALPILSHATTDLAPQLLPVVGGSGGSSFTQSCGHGEVVTGMRYRTSRVVDAVMLLCRTVGTNGKLGTERALGRYAGGDGGTEGVVRCASGSVVAGARIQAHIQADSRAADDSYVEGIALICRTWDPATRRFRTGDSFPATIVSFGSTASGSAAHCENTSQPVHGIRGLEASFVNAIGFTCDEP